MMHRGHHDEGEAAEHATPEQHRPYIFVDETGEEPGGRPGDGRQAHQHPAEITLTFTGCHTGSFRCSSNVAHRHASLCQHQTGGSKARLLGRISVRIWPKSAAMTMAPPMSTASA